MNERLVSFHVVEPGFEERLTLFEVNMAVGPDTRLALGEGDESAWRSVIQQAKGLISEHLAESRPSS